MRPKIFGEKRKVTMRDVEMWIKIAGHLFSKEEIAALAAKKNEFLESLSDTLVNGETNVENLIKNFLKI